ncbi:MAG: ribonuclease H-like domain-containing protein [Chloroflexi bacterium]|nr:ribonuclease H-like domain-containing protein [Chloroflexota bacterium]
MREGDFSVIDVETTGGSMDNIPVGFELLLTGARCGRTYAMYTSAPESLGQLADLLASFPGPVVTYNGARFDLPVLDDHFERLLGRRLKLEHHYDLMVEIERAAGRRISLDRLCLYTFGEQKVPWDHRHNARVWATEPHRLADYNRVDLDLTHELFMRVLRGEPLFLGDTTVVLPAPEYKLDDGR